MRKGFFNKKWYMSIVSLLFVAIIPLCSINLYNYSQVLSTTSQEETLDDEQNNVGGGIDTSENNDDDEEDVTANTYGNWTYYASTPTRVGNTYTIDSASDLAWMATQSGEVLSRTFNLTANIDLQDHYWVEIEDFSGVFNGNGYTITNMFIITQTLGESYITGLFGVGFSGKITNLIVEGKATLETGFGRYDLGMWYGSIVAEMRGGEISGCVSKVDVEVKIDSQNEGRYADARIGGIVGIINPNAGATATINRCINFGNITISGESGSYTTVIIGGIAGDEGAVSHQKENIRVRIYDCCNYGNIMATNTIQAGNSNHCVGGIMGRTWARDISLGNCMEYFSISNCINFGNVTGCYYHVGGIVGQASEEDTADRRVDNFTYIGHCANIGNVIKVTGNASGETPAYTECEIVGLVDGNGAQIDYCFAKLGNGLHSGAETDWIGRYGKYVKGASWFGTVEGDRDWDFRDGTGTARNNETFTGNFTSYGALFSGGYDAESINETWTAVDFYSTDVTDEVCQNSKFPVTLSWFVKGMEIEVKTWDSNCNLVNFTGNDFYLEPIKTLDGEELKGLHEYQKYSYSFYSTITMDYFSAFTMANNGGYSVTVYEKDTSEKNNLGRRIMGPRTDKSIEYALTGSDLNQGTYSGNFTDIIIVLELAQDPPPPPNIEIWTSDCLYDSNGWTINGLKLCGKGGTVEMNYDSNIGTCTPNGKVAVSKNDVSTADTIVTLRITANPGYEFIGLFADEDLENEEIPIASRRIERFNDLTYDEYLDDIPEEDIENLPNIPAKRVDVKTSDGYRIYEYTLDYSALITGMNIVPVGEESASGQDEVSANRADNLVHVTIIGGSGGGGSSSGGGNSSYDDQKQEDENKEEEEKFKYIVESISYVKSLDVAFVAYRQDYNLNVTYQGAGAEPFSLEKGYEKRELYAERGHNPAQYFFNAGTTDKVTSLKLDYGSKYFFNSAFVEYVADVSGAVEGYWSWHYGSSVRGMTFKDTYVELSLWEFFANVKMSAMCDPLPDTEIIFKYCESPRYDYYYTIYITDAYEEYCTEQYLPGQLVGETDYYGYTMISKENISVALPSGELVSLPATKIPVGATYREVFDFNRNNILSSDFISGLVDTSKIIEYPYTNVGGVSFTIDYTLSEVARRYEKEPITGYKEEDGYCLSDDYSDTNTTMLANTTLRDIINMYGDLSEDGCSVTLYSFFHLRDPYKIEFQTMVDGELVTLSMPANSDEYILTANGSNMTANSLEFTCEPFDLISVDVTDKLVYRYDGQKTTFYSFDCMTVGDSVLSESGTYSFQGIPTNDIEEFVIAVNFKEEFTIDNRILNSDTSISYNSSIWYIDSATDLLNIAYRVYCQGLPLAKKIVQTADIDFEGGYMLPIGTESQPFSSVYDGQYYRIENMSIVGGTADDIGLFGYTNGATIKNLTLMNADVSGGYNVGAVAGYATNTTFERVGSYNGIVSAMDVQTAGRGIFLTNGVTAVNVTKQNGTYTSISLGNNGTSYTVLSVMVADEIVNDSDRAYYIGDLIGRGDNVTIKICFVRKSNTINAEIGGFAGLLENSQVTNAYTSRSDFGNTIGTTLTHTHTDITDISTCPDCDDVFIW